jgi:hypothetical protein
MGVEKDGMCNICKLLINVVTVNRPKMLKGLNQNGKGYGWSARTSFHAICDSPGEQADTNPSRIISGNMVSPTVSIFYGKPTVRKADRQVGKGDRRKRKPSCNGADTGSKFARLEREQTSDRC